MSHVSQQIQESQNQHAIQEPLCGTNGHAKEVRHLPSELRFAMSIYTAVTRYPSRAQHILSQTGNDSDEVEDASILQPRRHSSNLLDVLASKVGTNVNDFEST